MTIAKMEIRYLFLLTSALMCNSLHAQQEHPTLDASAFLTGPSADTSVEYLKDYTQYLWGKTMRNSPEWEKASADMNFQLSTYIGAFSPLVGLQISRENTPSIYLALEYILNCGQETIKNTQTIFDYSLRPYAKFNEKSLVPNLEKQYSTISSYPSSFAFMGWLTALTFVEICPDKQNEILLRGYNLGMSPVIAGYNWDSDIVSGRLLACALIPLLHNCSDFNSIIKSARIEYEQKTGIANIVKTTNSDSSSFPNENLPDARRFLPEPPGLESVLFSYDLNQHILSSRKRATNEGKIATADVDVSSEYLAKIFSSAFGKTISSMETPQLYNLISRVNQTSEPTYNAVKEKYMRIRPYALLNQKTSYEPDEESYKAKGSYPSAHSAEGWLVAMVLSEINSESAEKLFARAYQYGQSRVITGYNWQSDVEAGRLVASTIYAYLHACNDFVTMMDSAKKEFNESTGIREEIVSKSNQENSYYKLDGTKVEGVPSRPGIYIHGNKKIAVK